MADFYQHPGLTTLHDLARFAVGEREDALASHARSRPLMLVIPALSSELDEPVFAEMIHRLRDHPFADPIVVSMNRMDAGQCARAQAFLAGLPGTHRVLWNGGPRLAAFHALLEAKGYGHFPDGKGTNVWMALGYALARGDIAAVAAHDADIVHYGRDLLARLCTPVLDPEMGYAFAKSYYARVGDRMFGRVTRLLVLPMIRALRETLGTLPLLDFLDGFRYPLAGEFAIDIGLAGRLRLPGHWGLETGMLCEIFRHHGSRKICQVGLGSGYEHRHRALETVQGNALGGEALAGMARDIVRTLVCALEREGVVWAPTLFGTLGVRYRIEAAEAIRRYHDDARLNGLRFEIETEQAAVARFGKVLDGEARAFFSQELAEESLPAWDALFREHPEFRGRLLDAVEADNAGA